MSLALKSNIFGLCSWWYGALWWLEAWHSAQSKAATTAAIQCSSKLPEQVEIQSWWLRNDVFIILDQCPDRADLGFPKPGTPANLKLSTRVMACVFQPLEVPTLGWTCSPGSSRAGQSNCTILWQASSPPSIDTSSSLQPTLSDFFLTSYMEDIFLEMPWSPLEMPWSPMNAHRLVLWNFSQVAQEKSKEMLAYPSSESVHRTTGRDWTTVTLGDRSIFILQVSDPIAPHHNNAEWRLW